LIQGKAQDLVQDDKKNRTELACHASELVSASGLFFLLSSNAPFIPVHRTGFSDAVLIRDRGRII
jgi:hypothetical protein